MTQAPSAVDAIPGYADFLTKLAEAMPKAPIFASSILFPQDGAWAFTVDGQDFCLAHPDVWKKLPDKISSEPNDFSMLGGTVIVDVDHPHERDRMRPIVMGALMKVIDGVDPSPDSPPTDR